LSTCRDILVVKLDFIGDHVLTTPFLANLRRNAPRARITLVVLDRAYPFAETCRFVDRVVTVSAALGRRLTFAAKDVATLAGFRRDYTEGRFDLALIPRRDIDFNGALQVAHGSRAKRIAGFIEQSTPARSIANRGEDRFYTDLVRDDRMVHESEHKLALLEGLGGTVTTRRASIDLSASDRDEAEAFLVKSFGRARRELLAVAPFVGDPRRQYPVDRLAAIVRRLVDRFDLDVVVVGGPLDAERGEGFAAAICDRAVSSLGRIAPRPSAALVEACIAFVGMDSGPAHLAAAVGTPAAAIFCHPRNGPRDHVNSPVRFAPWGEAGKVLVIQPETALPPCRDSCGERNAHCIAQLTEDAVFASLAEFVGRFAGA
jgi:heptosyltransferase-2